jgi:NitT/TauT family transport system substrate-binding protein
MKTASWFHGLLILGAVWVASGAAARAADEGQAPEKLILYTDWYAEADQGGFYEAVAQGIYASHGIAVKIQAGAPRMPIFPMIARNRAPFAISNSDDVITAVSEGFPLVIVMAFYQLSPVGIMFDAAHPLHSFRELDGRVVMAQPASAWVRFVEKKYQIKLNVIPITWGIGRFLSDPQRTFLQQAHVTNEPYLVRQAGHEAGVLPLYESGFRPYRVVYSNRDFVREHPEQVRAFVEASLEGWQQYLHGDPAPADALIKANNREMNDAILAFGRGAILQYHLFEGLAASGDAPGKVDPERLRQAIATLSELNVIRAAPAVGDVVFP